MASASVLAHIYDDFGPHSRVRSRSTERLHPNILRTPKVPSPRLRVITEESPNSIASLIRNRSLSPGATPRFPLPHATSRFPSSRVTPRSPSPRATPRSPSPRATPLSPSPRATPLSPSPRGTPRSPPRSPRSPRSPPRSPTSTPMRTRSLRSSNQNRAPDQNSLSRAGVSSRRNTYPDLPSFETLFPNHSTSFTSMRPGEYARMMRGGDVGPYSKRVSPRMRRAASCPEFGVFRAKSEDDMDVDPPVRLTGMIGSTRPVGPVGGLASKFKKMRL